MRRFRLLEAPVLLLVLGAILIASLCIGAYPVPLSSVMRGLGGMIVPETLWHPVIATPDRVVIQLIRAPRILLAALAGAGLGLSGAAMQGMFRNPLVGPDLIGISPGASAGAALAIVLGLPVVALSLFAWGGALLALVATLFLSRLTGGRTGLLALILAGVVVSSFFASLVGLAQYLADPASKLPTLVYWLLGSFAAADAVKVRTMAAMLLLGGLPILAVRWRLNLLALAEEDARTLGINVPRLRRLVILSAALIVAGQVAVSGVIGWIGLIVPHAARVLVGPDQRQLLPASAILGAAFTLLIDDVARTLAVQEIPIGLLSAIIGSPVFAALLWRVRGSGWHDA